MKPPRGLSEAEAFAWAKLAATVSPIDRLRPAPILAARPQIAAPKPVATAAAAKRIMPRPATPPPPNAPMPRPRRRQNTLDGGWDRKLKAGQITPNFTLDLHGHTLDSAYTRLMDGMAQARAMEARLVLIVTGKSRPVDAADRATSRGAIRAKILDWLAAGEHGDNIAAIRKAHRRHGGDGALYLVLRRSG